MKSYQRFFCLLPCLVLLFGLLSVPANAEELEVKDYYIYAESYIKALNTTQYAKTTTTVWPNNGGNEVNTVLDQRVNYTTGSGVKRYIDFYIKYVDNSTIVKKGAEATVRLERIYDFVSFSAKTGSSSDYITFVTNTNSSASCILYYTDGSVGYGSASITKRSNGDYDITATFTPTKDVLNIGLTVISTIPTDSIIPYSTYIANGNYYYTYADNQIGETVDGEFILQIDQKDETVSLLDGIIGWVKNIWTGISDGFTNLMSAIADNWANLGNWFTNLGSKITDVWSSITSGFSNMMNQIEYHWNHLDQWINGLWNTVCNLPMDIWYVFETGLQYIFVPDAEYMADYKDKWDGFLEKKFGALYEVSQIIVDAWNSIQVSVEQETIFFPEVTLHFGDSSFTFGGWDVDIVPDGFEVLRTACKLITGIVCTTTFFNGMKRRYDSLMGDTV